MGGVPCWILPRPAGIIVKFAPASVHAFIGLLSRLGESILKVWCVFERSIEGYSRVDSGTRSALMNRVIGAR